MPHCTVEYTNNIENQLNIKEILQDINDSLISHEGLFSANGIRSRAVMLTDYKIGDGQGNNAFIHVSVKIAAGRTAEAKQAVQEHLFSTLKKSVGKIETDKKIALSLELSELNSDGNFYSQI